MLSLLLFYKDAKAMKVEGVICCFVVIFFDNGDKNKLSYRFVCRIFATFEHWFKTI
jgi:hypothetical protein